MSHYKNCQSCGCEFSAIRISKKYCSHACKIYAYRARIIQKQKLADNLARYKVAEQEQNDYFERLTANFEKYKADSEASQK